MTERKKQECLTSLPLLCAFLPRLQRGLPQRPTYYKKNRAANAIGNFSLDKLEKGPNLVLNKKIPLDMHHR